ncbi:MAG: ABC transporter substrate-binding protein, partial [Acidimicrobiales bacterium]
IEVPIIHTLAATLTALEKRQVDMVPLSLPQSDVIQVEDFATRVATGPSYLGTALVFNLRKAPFNQVKVRQAVAQAINLDLMVSAVGDATGAGGGFTHPSSDWASGQGLHSYDPGAARTALAPLHLTGLTVLAPNNDPVQMQAAAQVALALRRVGVAASVRYLSVGQLDAAMGAGGTTPSRSAPSFLMAIGAIDPGVSYDPDALPADLAASGYGSSAFDALAARVSTTADPVARKAAVRAELDLLATEVPEVPLFFATGQYAYHPGVYNGWVYVKGGGILDKLSFLASRAPTRAPSAAAPAARTSSGFDFGIVAWALVGVAAALVALLAAGLALGRRR